MRFDSFLKVIQVSSPVFELYNSKVITNCSSWESTVVLCAYVIVPVVSSILHFAVSQTLRSLNLFLYYHKLAGRPRGPASFLRDGGMVAYIRAQGRQATDVRAVFATPLPLCIIDRRWLERSFIRSDRLSFMWVRSSNSISSSAARVSCSSLFHRSTCSGTSFSLPYEFSLPGTRPSAARTDTN